MVNTDVENQQWSVFIATSGLVVERKKAGSLPWDSGDYYYLRATPDVPFLKGPIFGDWVLVVHEGVFLQKWNHPRRINCDLIFIRFDSLRVAALQTNILSKHWRSQIEEGKIKFTFETRDKDLAYVVEREDLMSDGI